MTEYQVIGSRYAVHSLEAKILPERNLLHDMLHNLDGRYPVISQEEFEVERERLLQLKRIG